MPEPPPWLKWLLSRDDSVRLVRWIFLRGLALIAFLAFLSLHVQLLGLIGHQGILPIAPAIEGAKVDSAVYGFLKSPTLVWWFHSDTALLTMSWAGMVLSGLLLLDVFPKLVLFLLWLIYLSLVLAGRIFLSYQWDLLVTETLFASIFLLRPIFYPGVPVRVLLDSRYYFSS